MKTPQQIEDMAKKKAKIYSDFGIKNFPTLNPDGFINDSKHFKQGFILGATQMQKDLLEELKHLCTYNSTAIGKQAECYLKVMPTLIEILDKHDIGLFLRGIVYRTYTQAQKDLLDSASEGFDECFSKYATESNLHHEFDAHYFWQACALSKMKELQEKDAEIERMKKDNQSYYENNQKIIKSLELKEEKYQEAVEDIEFLTNDNTLDDIKNNELFTGFEEIRTKYGLDKEEK